METRARANPIPSAKAFSRVQNRETRINPIKPVTIARANSSGCPWRRPTVRKAREAIRDTWRVARWLPQVSMRLKE